MGLHKPLRATSMSFQIKVSFSWMTVGGLRGRMVETKFPAALEAERVPLFPVSKYKTS